MVESRTISRAFKCGTVDPADGPAPGKSPRFAATSSRSGDAPEPQPGGLSEPRLCAIQFRPIALPVDGLRSECACDSEFREKPVVVVYFDR